MVNYICIRCSWKTTNKSHLNNHLNRKFKCNFSYLEDIPNDILIEKLKNNEYFDYYKKIKDKNNKTCECCKKIFNNRSNLLRHKKYHCKSSQIINNFQKEDLSLVKFNKMIFIQNKKQFWQNKKYINNMKFNINLLLKGIYNKLENINFKKENNYYYLLEDKDIFYDEESFLEIILNNVFHHFKNYLLKNKLENKLEHYITYLNSKFLKYNHKINSSFFLKFI